MKKANSMQVKELTDYLEQIAPIHLQEAYDNTGYIVGNPADEIKGVIICLDSTEAVVDEAIGKGCNVIIAHHPIIFQGLRKITGENYIERTVLKAIRNHITIYAIHTNLDNVLIDGVNMKIAEKLGLQSLEHLKPKNEEAPAYTSSQSVLGESLRVEVNSVGSGLIGSTSTPMEETYFLEYVQTQLNTACVRHTKLLGKSVSKVALCGGSGSFLLPDAIAAGADVFISGDFKYHQFFDANDKLVILDVGHFESEQFTIDLLHDIISRKFSNFAVLYSETNTNPIHYLTSK